MRPTWLSSVGPEQLGLIPFFFDEDDPRPAREQIDERYISGWHPLPGINVNIDDLIMTYPSDPPFKPLAVAKLHGELLVFYEHEFLAIVQPDGSYEASRID